LEPAPPRPSSWKREGRYSGGTTERPGLQRLLADVTAKRVDVIVFYKVDRLIRLLVDFAMLIELFDHHGLARN
jgi:site-specific DNA recombinase